MDATAAEGVLRDWFVDYLSELLGRRPDAIDVTKSFNKSGLDSSATIGMTGDLGEWLGFDFDPTMAYDHPSIDQLARHLAGMDEVRARLSRLNESAA